MSKKLTPIEALNDLIDYLELEHYTLSEDERVVERKQIIETALKRLEEHDKLFKKYKIDDNWLEACLYVIKNNFPMNTKTKLNKLKAFEIIKEKDVHIVWLKESRTLEAYNEELEKRRMHDRLLTHEEYDLLKEVLL